MTMRHIAAAGSVAAIMLAAGVAGCTSKEGEGDSASVSAATSDTSHSGSMSNGGKAPESDLPPAGPSNAQPIRPAPTADTLRGIVRVVGAAIDAGPVLRPNGGGPQVTLLGAHAATLSRLSGADVWVSGTRNGMRGFDVGRFLVRSVDGVSAIDGTVVARGGGYAIVTTGDRAEHPIVDPPPALRARVGARVWITGPLESGGVTFGVISDR